MQLIPSLHQSSISGRMNPVRIAFEANSLDQVCAAESLVVGFAVASESFHLAVLLSRVWLCMPRLDITACYHFSIHSA
jgi:hypothetical protein